jgi:hypothetical protein
VKASYWQLLREYEYLFEKQKERARSAHAHLTAKPKWQRDWRINEKKGEKCDSFLHVKYNTPIQILQELIL